MMTPAAARVRHTSMSETELVGNSRSSSHLQTYNVLDAFGTSVLVYRNTVIVGAPKHTHSGVRFTGAAYVFELNGDTWVQKTKLVADDAAKSDNFGGSLGNER